MVFTENTGHYTRAEACDGWHLPKRADMSVVQEIILQKGQGLKIPPLVKHQFKNRSGVVVHFLIISGPPTRGDRVNL